MKTVMLATLNNYQSTIFKSRNSWTLSMPQKTWVHTLILSYFIVVQQSNTVVTLIMNRLHTHRYWITVHRIWYCEYHPGNFGSLWDVQPRASGGKVTGKFSNTSGLPTTNRMLISASRHVDQGWIKNDHPLKGTQSGPPPRLIKILIQGSLLLQGTSINLFGGTSPPPRCNKWI